MSKFGVLVMGPAGAGKVCEHAPDEKNVQILNKA